MVVVCRHGVHRRILGCLLVYLDLDQTNPANRKRQFETRLKDLLRQVRAAHPDDDELLPATSEALKRDPQNQQAIAGEGTALVEKGALEKARRNLTRLEQLCGKTCAPTQDLAAAIARGPAQRMVSAEAVQTKPVVTAN